MSDAHRMMAPTVPTDTAALTTLNDATAALALVSRARRTATVRGTEAVAILARAAQRWADDSAARARAEVPGQQLSRGNR